MNNNQCAMCFMSLETKQSRSNHIWDMMISCDSITTSLANGNIDEAIQEVYALKECLSQIRGLDL